jgi:hypothetical protein
MEIKDFSYGRPSGHILQTVIKREIGKATAEQEELAHY